MKNSPDQVAESEIEHVGEFKRSIWWKIYFFIITILSAFGMVENFSDPNAGIAEYICLVMWMVGTVGFFGFVFIKPVYKTEFWMKLFFAYLAYTICYYFITEIDLRMGMRDSAFYVVTAIAWLISLPAYYALYAYSKPSYPAWKKV